MKQQKLLQINLQWRMVPNECLELSVQDYLNKGWVIVSYQVCPKGGASGYPGDIVVLLEKEVG